MGGDGGVVATNRKYMRGAGSADHTGDYDRNNNNSKEHNALEAMTTCALTKTPLFSKKKNNSNNNNGPIVACCFGRLYHKEAAVEALLSKKKVTTAAIVDSTKKNNKPSSSLLGDHIRKLSDLYDVRFHRDEESTQKRSSGTAVPITCPVTGKTLQGIIPAILLVPGKPDTPNVLSASALQQLSKEELELEYGPITKQVRLAPPPEMLKQIQQDELEARLAATTTTKKKKKQKKKQRKEHDDNGKREEKQIRAKGGKTKAKVVGLSAKVVGTGVATNQALSSLFTTSDRTKTDKDRKDSLFAR
eukprot:scaffold1807_cov140-Cylindrotheca_fusiformis.AAC.22